MPTPGSHKHRANQRRILKRTARAARRRKERLHEWTTQLARRFSRLEIICPPILEATRSARGNRQQPGVQVALKAAFNRRLLEQGMGYAVAMLQYKIEEREGRTERIVDREAAALIGNHIVAAARLNRDLRKATRDAP